LNTKRKRSIENTNVENNDLTFTTALKQSLNSNDKLIFQKCLENTDKTIISNTISGLNNDESIILLNKLIELLDSQQ